MSLSNSLRCFSGIVDCRQQWRRLSDFPTAYNPVPLQWLHLPVPVHRGQPSASPDPLRSQKHLPDPWQTEQGSCILSVSVVK